MTADADAAEVDELLKPSNVRRLQTEDERIAAGVDRLGEVLRIFARMEETERQATLAYLGYRYRPQMPAGRVIGGDLGDHY